MTKSLLQPILLALLFLINVPLSAQQIFDVCPSLPAGPFTAGETINVPLVTSGFNDLTGIQIFLNYESQDLEFVSGTSLEGPSTQFSEPIDGEIRMVFFDPLLAGTSYPDGTEFINLTFQVNSDVPAINLTLVTNESALEATTTDAVVLPTSFCGALVSTGGNNNNTTELCAQVNQDEIVAGDPFVANAIFWGGFNGVTSFTYQVNYDPSLMNYDNWTAIQEFGAGLVVDQTAPGLLTVTWSGEPLTLASGVGFVIFNFTALQDAQDPPFNLITTPGSANIFYGETEGTIEFCGGISFDPDSFVDFCPENPEGPFSTDETVDVLINVENFVGMVSAGIPLTYDSTKFEIEGVWADLPTDLAATSWEAVPGGKLRVFMIDFGGGGVTIPDGDALLQVVFRALEPADSIDVQIDPSAGDFFVASDFELNEQFPVTACHGYYLGNVLTNVRSSVYLDANNDCSGEITGDALRNWMVTFTQTVSGAQFSAFANEYGNAYLSLPVSDYTYEWTTTGNPMVWDNCVPQSVSVTENTSIDDLLVSTVNTLADCSEVAVTISSFNLRPCFGNNTFRINYLNQGTAIAEGAYIDVLIDEAFIPDDSSIPFEDLGDGFYRFQLGDLAPNEYGTIHMYGLIDCDFPVGATICAEATIYPYRTGCSFTNPSFAGGELQVTTDCVGDSVTFRIENVGDGPTGPVDFTIIEDVVIYMGSTIDLNIGEAISFSAPAAGTTYRLETDLPLDAPYVSQGLGIREGCGTLPGGGITTGMVTAYSLLDGDLWFDRYCLETSAAYDPNDKTATPSGVGPENYILPNQRIDYRIRFQNTGTDTAFTVVIRDTIDTEVLDMNDLRPGISSHPYHLNVNGNELIFTFEDILLPDSTTNEPASNGFVHFSLNLQPDLEDFTLVENTAAIYFDFNDPIFTDPSQLIINRNLLTTKVVNFTGKAATIPVYPSPTNGPLFLDLTDQQQPTLVVVYDVFGREVLQRQLAAASTERIDLSQLPSGRYAYRLLQSGQLLQTGVVVKE